MKKILSAIALLFVTLAFAGGKLTAAGLSPMEFTVNGTPRTALVYWPAQTSNAPVVFVFHGHGGSAAQAARSFAMETAWPEAIVVYMQGLPTPGKLTDAQGKLPGWQLLPGGEGDRDLKFFDAVLARLKKDFSVDAKKIYATGHSNGGGFTYLLWLKRADVFAAFAPSAAAALGTAQQFAPKPALILGGTDDPLVKFSWQQRTMDVVKRINHCVTSGTPWAAHCTLYPSDSGTPLVTCIYPGGHEFHRDAPALIAKFFKEHPAAAAR